ncbi:MAG: DNA repair protein RadC [Ignavibacteriales bacterium]|nr:DNA repair protein RadC [Ignavibacteriales bacterium]
MKSTESAPSGAEGHRERLRARFLKSGFAGFHDYEALELALTYAIPRRDVKPIAKELLRRFDSVAGVLGAELDELAATAGMGEKSAAFVKTIDALIGLAFERRVVSKRKPLATVSEAAEFFRRSIGNKPNERFKAIYLNNRNEPLFVEDVGEGTVSEVAAYPRRIVENAIRTRAASVIVGHNHPGGFAKPSRDDDRLTKQIKDALAAVSIPLQEHLIVTESEFYSYRKMGFL